MTTPEENAERLRALIKLRTAINFWTSFSRSARFNHHTKETIQITLESLKYTVNKLENGEIGMKLVKKDGK